MLELLAQGGQELVQIVGEVSAGWKVYTFGKQQYDRLKGFIGEKQMENAAKLSENTSEKLRGIPADRLSAPSPSVVTPLLEAAIQESRDELQDRWAALLANSMIDSGRKVRAEYIHALAQMEPLDAVVLAYIERIPNPGIWERHGREENVRYINESQNHGISKDDWLVSCRALQRLGFIEPVAGMMLHPQLTQPDLTAFGRKFLEACKV